MAIVTILTIETKMTIMTVLAIKTDIYGYHDRPSYQNRHNYCDHTGHQNQYGYHDRPSY